MKKLILFAVLILFSPFAMRDVAEILPVETLVLSREDDGCRLTTDLGYYGLGQTPKEALENLLETAPGKIVLSTTRSLVVQAKEELYGLLKLDALRPGTAIFYTRGGVDASDCNQYVSRHRGNATLGKYLACLATGEILPVPVLEGENGRYSLAE